MLRLATTIALFALAVAAPTAAAAGLTQLDGPKGCITTDGATRSGGLAGDCSRAAAIGGPRAIAVSPDGRDVYVASGGAQSDPTRPFLGAGIASFSRDPADGSLTQSGCITRSGTDDLVPGALCKTLAQLGPVHALVVAPESAPGGSRVYAIANGPRSGPKLFEFARDPATGTLSPAAAPRKIAVLTRGGTLALGPNGDTLYVGGDKGIAVFQRYGQPGLVPLPGTLGCITATGRLGKSRTPVCQAARGLGETRSLAIAPAGAAAYASSYAERANGQFGGAGVIVFVRGPDGALTQRPGKKGCTVDRTGDRALTPGCTRTNGLQAVDTVQPLGDAAVLVRAGDRLLTFTRAPASPDLGLRHRARLPATSALATPFGETVYATAGALYGGGASGGFGTVDAYARAASGALAHLPEPGGCTLETTGTPPRGGAKPPARACAPGRALTTPHALAVSPDGANVYLAAGGRAPLPGGIAVFSRRP